MFNLTPMVICKRILVYCVGLFLMAMGVALSVLSDLGVSPMSSAPYVLSEIIPSISMGTFSTGLYCSYIVIQAILLGKKFHPVRLLQIVGSFVFGWFVDFNNWLVALFLPEPDNYLVRLVWLAIGMAFVGFGIFMYIAPGIPTLPGEALVQVISEKYHIPLHRVKVGFDVAMTAIAIALSLVYFHGLHGVREGTVIAALGIGKFLGLFASLWQGRLNRFIEKVPDAQENDG